MELRTKRLATRTARRTARPGAPTPRGRLLVPADLTPGVLKSGRLDPREPLTGW